MAGRRGESPFSPAFPSPPRSRLYGIAVHGSVTRCTAHPHSETTSGTSVERSTWPKTGSTSTTGGESAHLPHYHVFGQLKYRRLSPELYLRRPGDERYRLDNLLKRKAEDGVKIFIII